MILLDTNLLIRMTRPLDPQCGVARAAINSYRARGDRLVIVPQNLYEFWAVATRLPGPPPSGGNGLGSRTEGDAHLYHAFACLYRIYSCQEQPDTPLAA